MSGDRVLRTNFGEGLEFARLVALLDALNAKLRRVDEDIALLDALAAGVEDDAMRRRFAQLELEDLEGHGEAP